MNRVLFVDDEVLILSSLKRGLAGEPYESYFASSGEEALRILADQEISVLVTDMKMPGMNGLELLKAVKEPYPDLIKLVLSGYTQLPQVLVTVNQGDIFKFITKPWNLEEELKGIIQESVDYYNYRMEMRKARERLEKKNVTFQNILKTYDDKLMSMRSEVLLMRNMSGELMQEILGKIDRWDGQGADKAPLLQGIARSEELLREAFQLIPTQVKRFNTKQLVDEMRRFMVEHRLKIHVEFGIDAQMRTLIRGRYDLLLFMLKRMLTQLVVESLGAQVSVVISGEETEDSAFLFRAAVEADGNGFAKGPGAEADLIWLSQLAEGFGGKLRMRELGVRKALIFTMICED